MSTPYPSFSCLKLTTWQESKKCTGPAPEMVTGSEEDMVAERPRGIIQDQGSNLHPLHWQADS